MRRALNSNPMVQVGAIALLGVVVAFLMLTRLKGGEEPPPADPVTVAPVEAGVTPSVGAVAPEAADPAAAGEAAAPVDPAAPVAPGGEAVADGEFVAGPGLPAGVARAYDSGDTVVVLITREGGIDDQKLRKITDRLRGEDNVALFHSYARDIAVYSRIAQGADVDRVPALIALSPKKVNDGGPPVATLSYGFRGYDSVRQAVRDASYDGQQLPYHP